MKNNTEVELSFELFTKETERSVSLAPGVYKPERELIDDIAVAMGHGLCYRGMVRRDLVYLYASPEIRIDTFYSDTGNIKERANVLLNQLKNCCFWNEYKEYIVQIRHSNQDSDDLNELKQLMLNINNHLPSSSDICFSIRVDNSLGRNIQLLIVSSRSIDLDDAIIPKFNIYHKKDFKSSFGEHAVLCDLLDERKRRLDNEFDFSAENMEKLRKIDELLRESSQAVAQKTEKIFYEAKQRVEADGFTHDFEMEIFIRPNVDALWEEGHTNILEAIDGVWKNNNLYSGIGRSAFYDSCEAVEYLNSLEMDDGRYITNTPLDNLKFCWAFHNLIDHSPYALVDILRIPEFWNEVQIRYQNFAKNQ